MTFRNALVPTLLAAAVMAMLPSAAHAERAFTVRDMAALDRYSSPALSPDGRKLARCEKSQNVSSWRFLEDACPSAGGPMPLDPAPELHAWDRWS